MHCGMLPQLVTIQCPLLSVMHSGKSQLWRFPHSFGGAPSLPSAERMKARNSFFFDLYSSYAEVNPLQPLPIFLDMLYLLALELWSFIQNSKNKAPVYKRNVLIAEKGLLLLYFPIIREHYHCTNLSKKTIKAATILMF